MEDHLEYEYPATFLIIVLGGMLILVLGIVLGRM